MADAYTDLAALAAKDPHGRLWFCPTGRVWSYGGAPLDTRATNLCIPVESVPDTRVQAALADGSWVGSVIDTLAVPVRLLAVQPAPAPGVAFRPLTPADLGTPVAA